MVLLECPSGGLFNHSYTFTHNKQWYKNKAPSETDVPVGLWYLKVDNEIGSSKNLFFTIPSINYSNKSGQ